MDTESTVFAVAAAAAIWGFAQIIIVATQGEKRKLKKRLSARCGRAARHRCTFQRGACQGSRKHSHLAGQRPAVSIPQPLSAPGVSRNASSSKFLLIMGVIGAMSMFVVTGFSESILFGMIAGAGRPCCRSCS